MISIIMPMYNSSQFILETLKSIKEQTFSDFECLIIDDHSLDDSIQIAQNFTNKDSRFQIYTRPKHLKKGPSSCRNYGCSLAIGNFIQFFDSDDIMHPNHLLYKINAISDSDFVVCKLLEFNGNFEISKIQNIQSPDILKSDSIFEDFVCGNFPMMMVAPMWRTELLKKHLPFNENLQILEDHELYARILSSTTSYRIVNQDLIYYRQSENSAMNTFYNSIQNGIDSYLLAKKSVLNLSHSKKIKLAILKMILGVMRMGLAQKEYTNCQKCFTFITGQKLDFTSLLKIKLLRIKIVYQFCKSVGKGDTFLKKYLKL